MTEQEIRGFYASPAWRALRAAVLARDHFWCRVCGRRTANTVHHILPVTVRPDLMLDADNLEAICPVCHNREHPEKGYRRKPPRAETGIADGLRVIVIDGRKRDG